MIFRLPAGLDAERESDKNGEFMTVAAGCFTGLFSEASESGREVNYKRSVRRVFKPCGLSQRQIRRYALALQFFPHNLRAGT